MPQTRCAQIVHQLRLMYSGQSRNCFHLNDNRVRHEQIRHILTNDKTVFIGNRYRKLLAYIQPQFHQPMAQRILIHLLQVSGKKPKMHLIGGFTNHVANRLPVFQYHAQHPLRLCDLCGFMKGKEGGWMQPQRTQRAQRALRVHESFCRPHAFVFSVLFVVA